MVTGMIGQPAFIAIAACGAYFPRWVLKTAIAVWAFLPLIPIQIWPMPQRAGCHPGAGLTDLGTLCDKSSSNI